MRHVLLILAFSALLIVATLPITNLRPPQDGLHAVGFVAAIVAFVAAVYLGLFLIRPERWVAYALIVMTAGAVGGIVWWAIAGRDESLVGSALGGAFAGFALFLSDSGSVPTISPGRKRGESPGDASRTASPRRDESRG